MLTFCVQYLPSFVSDVFLFWFRCKPMDAEDCEEYTDVFFIKFSQLSNARFTKEKLDESVFLGNRLQVSYAPQFESILDTKEKLEVRRNEVLGRIRSSVGSRSERLTQYSPWQGSSSGNLHHHMSPNKREYTKTLHASHIEDVRFSHVSSNKVCSSNTIFRLKTKLSIDGNWAI
uniref:Uncharacterized protein n=1 Tax=Aegilops tauschii subsp. strangulata TaxID=200361 RepID=A0A453ASM3_AEGTS